jgi:hypothetical protein
MGEQTDRQTHGKDESPSTSDGGRQDYEPPKLIAFGTVAELTGAQLKHSNSADLVSFKS